MVYLDVPHFRGWFTHQTFQVPKMEVFTYIQAAIQAVCKAYVRENPAFKLRLPSFLVFETFGDLFDEVHDGRR